MEHYKFHWAGHTAHKGHLSLIDKANIAVGRNKNPHLTNREVLILAMGLERYNQACESTKTYRTNPGSIIHSLKQFCRGELARANQLKNEGFNPLDDEILNILIKGGIIQEV